MALCTHNRQKWGRCSEVNITFVSLLTGVRPIFFLFICFRQILEKSMFPGNSSAREIKIIFNQITNQFTNEQMNVLPNSMAMQSIIFQKHPWHDLFFLH